MTIQVYVAGEKVRAQRGFDLLCTKGISVD
jgi:hypothetical protein